MLNERKIAVFIDVDNCDLQFNHYESAINQVAGMGDIICGKIYGVSEKKNKEIIIDAEKRGFDMAFPVRIKKRGTKVFDNRIAIDVVETIFANESIDAVAIVSAPSDMVHLFRLLTKYNIKVIAQNNYDEASERFVDEVLDLGKVTASNFQKAAPIPKKRKPQPKPAAAKPVVEPTETQNTQDEAKITEELLQEIEQLRKQNLEAQQKREKAEQKPAAKQPEQKSATKIADEAQELLKQIEQMKNQPAAEPRPNPAQSFEQPTVRQEPRPNPAKTEPIAKQPAASPQPDEQSAQSARYSEIDDELLKRIEQLRNTSGNEDASVLIEKLQSLFDED